jgi:hypothetical protein
VELGDRGAHDGWAGAQDVVAGVRHDEQPAVADLARQGVRLGHGHERVAVPRDDEGRRVDGAQVGRAEQRLGRDVRDDRG